MKPFFSFIVVILAALLVSTGASADLQETRRPYVAGAFYPAEPAKLSAMIDDFLSKVPPFEKSFENVQVLVEPHAGYIYSGQTAAYGYKLISGRHFDTVLLIGPCHRAFFRGASVWKSGSWQTPLGEVTVDSELAGAIAKENGIFQITQDAHATEHSLEAQLPFLQKVLTDFKIVPILVSDPSLENARLLAHAILKNIQGKKVLIICSTDMSHYYEDSVARKMDALTLDLIKKMDTEGLLREMEKKNSELCGIAAMETVLELAKLLGNMEIQVLNYSNSGETVGDKTKVVGYGASVIYGKESARLVENPGVADAGALNQEEGKELLKIARQTVESYVSSGKTPEFTVAYPELKSDRAAFVTLMENGNLRGCIGNLVALEPLYLAVRDMAVQAAAHDPRFTPVRPDELKAIKVEISVLSVPRKAASAEDIVIGKHGVIVKKGVHSGVFLPKVAEAFNYDKEAFLSELCDQKASLPRDCWRDPAVELYTFTSQDFKE